MWQKRHGGHAPKSPPTIAWELNGERLRFTLANDSEGIEWLMRPPVGLGSVDEQRCRVLVQWLMDGIVEMEGHWLSVDLEAFFLSDPGDRQALELAPSARFTFELRAKGTLHEPDVTLELQVHSQGRPQIGLTRHGCFLEDGIDRFLLSEAEYVFLRQVEAFNRRPPSERTYESQLRTYAHVKQAAARVDARLDHYLKSETAVVPGDLGIELVSVGPDELEVRPALSEADPGAVARALDTYRSAPEILTLQQPNGGRQRLIFEPELQEGLNQIKRVRRLSGKARRDFLNRPQEFLDAYTINLEDFSERIKGIGQYQVRYFPMITKRERSWIPEAIALVIASDDPAVDPVQVAFTDLAEFEPLERALDTARKENESSLCWQGHELPIDGDTERTFGAIRAALEIRQQHEASQDELPEAPASAAPAADNAPEQSFLLIMTNLEQKEYAEASPAKSAPALKLTRPDALLPHVSLLPHQVEGIAWLQTRSNEQQRGVILADDMGLGKTLQVLTYLAWYGQVSSSPRPILVVAPVALLENWRDEYYKFLDPVFGPPLELHGPNLARLKTHTGGGREYQHEGGRILLDIAALQQHQLVLTTYETIRDYQFSLASIHWGVVVTDEAQKIKTPGALVTNAAKALKTDFRIVATGTPVENSLVDLWCLMDFAQPGMLGALKTFRTEFDQPRDRAEDAGEANAQRLRERIDAAFLRRLKSDILQDLPRRIEHEVPVPMSTTQAQRYLEETSRYRAGQGPGSILGMLQRLRSLSSHPDLLLEAEPRVSLKTLATDAPKLHWVLQQLSSIAERQEKCVLFTEDRKLQRLLAQIIQGTFGFTPFIVNGEVPGSSSRGLSRKSLIDTFQEQPGFNAIILSPVAVGFGLTITAANHAIHVTRLWNPAKEDQATDRLHRIGQTRDVHVYYPVASDPHQRFVSFDQILATLLAEKRQLAKNVLYPTEDLAVNQEALARLLLS